MKMNERQVWRELWRRLHIDLWLFIGLVVITGYGMLVLYSASGANEAMYPGCFRVYGHARNGTAFA